MSLLGTKDVPVEHGWLEVGNGSGSRGVEIGNRRKCEKIISLILGIHQKSKLQRICFFKTNNFLLYDFFCLAIVACLSTTREMCKEEIFCINNYSKQ